MLYRIKVRTVYNEPVIELPDDSRIVSVEHQDVCGMVDGSWSMPETWTVVYLEPISGQ